MSAPRRFFVLLNVALIISWITMAIVVFERLPASIPMHFGPSGAADSFAERSIGTWFALPAIGVSTTLLLLGLSSLTQRRPALFNVPSKDVLLSLPPAQQRPLFEQISMLLTLLSTSILLLFMAIHYDTWRVSTGSQQGLSAVSWAAMALCVGGTLVAMPIWMLRFRHRVRNAAASATPLNTIRRSS